MKCVVAIICGTVGGNFSFLNIVYQFKNELPTKQEIAELVGTIIETYEDINEASILNIIPIQDEEKLETKDEEEWNDEC